ncbi:hypothetical protein RCWATA_76 [Rhodobacter phage RcWata]|nr:hypothetical protein RCGINGERSNAP_78 [Rhodobacter phage RcGingersnap]UUV43150.1 hypothetical protein RCBIGEAGLE_78 [Rhodobacter phage RcBigEagle]UUV43345.1 hypothetical protein RCDORA_76 [Rhodobacter phage RcDora]UUV43448.1 hypothetical protein RCEXPLORER_79 [Rhodobacter phage RcExplorer]UUV44997.1 hypothetical protein RCWATA_76 [Rhodobacter phage RcWata]UUV45096.1 hypothetical protein RCWHITEOAK_78 [Rhodobacter phage RcWhiteOak]
MSRKSYRYRFPNGTTLATGLNPSAVPGWAPTQVRVPLSRGEAASALWQARRAVKRLG